MARARDPRANRLIDVLSPRGRVLLAVAIFLTFAPMLVMPVHASGFTPLSMAAISIISGAIGLAYAMSFTWTIRFLPVALVLHTTPFVGYWGLLPQWLWPRADALNIPAIFAMLSIAGGYAVFIVIIAGEGQRSVRQAAELELASRMHADLTPPIETAGKWGTVVGRSVASASMGGDLIDVIDHGDHADIVLADVSGHGVRAGVAMAMLKTSVRSASSRGLTVEEIAREANEALVKLTASDLFATAWLARLHVDCEVELVGCGHPPGILLRAGGATERIESDAPPLGIVADLEIEPLRARLAAGDRLVLYSDGLTEAGVERGEMLGIDGFVSMVDARRDSGDGIVEQVLLAVAQHAPAEDDRSLLVIEAGSGVADQAPQSPGAVAS
jgi:hypothetical protein